MDQTGYVLLAIGIIVLLAVVAIVSYVLYQKTPVPKGCENLEPDPGICGACLKSGCPFYPQYHAPKVGADSGVDEPKKPSAPGDKVTGVAPSKPDDKGDAK